MVRPRRNIRSARAGGHCCATACNAFPGQPYPGNYLPGHTTFDLTLGKDFGERFAASVNAINQASRRVGLDNSVTFGGFHRNNPREV